MTARIFSSVFFSLLALGLPFSLHAQEEVNPLEPALKKMRETLRSTMIQLQTSEAERATLQAAKEANEKTIKELTAKVASLTKLAAADKADAEKKITDLESQTANKAVQNTKLTETLGKWKEGYGKAASVAQAKEAERAQLQSKVIVLERKVASHERKNVELYAVGIEILDRLEKFSLGKVLIGREPFTRLARVRMETLVQDLEVKLKEKKIREGDSDAPVEAPAPAETAEKKTAVTASNPPPAAAPASPPKPANNSAKKQ